MSRVSEIVAYLNLPDAPTARQQEFYFDSIRVTEELKKIRRQHRLDLTKERKKPKKS